MLGNLRSTHMHSVVQGTVARHFYEPFVLPTQYTALEYNSRCNVLQCTVPLHFFAYDGVAAYSGDHAVLVHVLYSPPMYSVCIKTASLTTHGRSR